MGSQWPCHREGGGEAEVTEAGCWGVTELESPTGTMSWSIPELSQVTL